MAEGALTIGDVAKQAGCKAQTIRYYEQIALLSPPARSTGNQRLYDGKVVDRLRFIRHSRELGFGLDAIRELLRLNDRPDQSCSAADDIARRQLAATERRIARLVALKRELERMIAECAGGRVADCRVIEVLADHRRCLAPEHGAPGAPGAFATAAARGGGAPAPGS